MKATDGHSDQVVRERKASPWQDAGRRVYVGGHRTVDDGMGGKTTLREWRLEEAGRDDPFDPSMQQEQYQLSFTVPSQAARRWLTDPANPKCPLFRFIGNAKAKERLSRAAYAAWGRDNHCCSEQSFALLGPSSVGKTTLARLFGETVMLPFIEIQPKASRNADELFMVIRRKLESIVVDFADGTASLKMIPGDDYTWVLPPCVIFIDEAHALDREMVPELLKGIEPKDGIMAVGDGAVADCRNACWIIATTERGRLFPPFDNRFSKIQMETYTAAEMAQIVKLNNPDWEMDVCRLVTNYSSRVPREALAFAIDMRLEKDRNGGEWTDVAARVARSHSIDPFGLTRKRLDILVALGQMGPIARGRMCDIAQCQIEEMEKFQMPALLACTVDDGAMVVVTTRGYAITERGLRELDKRGIPHQGEEVVAPSSQRLDFGGYDPDNFGTPVVDTRGVYTPLVRPDCTMSPLIEKLAKALGR